MGVRRVQGGTQGSGKPARQAKKKKIKRKGPPPVDLTEMVLPTEKSKPVLDLRRYETLIYGAPGVGKTTALASVPGMLIITTEYGSKGLELYQMACPSWLGFLKIIELVENDPMHYKNVAIDTIDRLYDMCGDYICSRLGVETLGVDEDGKKDRGTSYNLMNREMRDALERLAATGLGIFFVSHDKDVTIRPRTGGEYDKHCASLSDSRRAIIEGRCDFIFAFDFARNSDGQEMRICITVGDDTVTAKAREIAGRTLPKYLEVLKRDWFDYLKSAWRGEHDGLDPKTLQPSKRSSKAGGAMINDDYVDTRVRPAKVHKKVGKKGGNG